MNKEVITCEIINPSDKYYISSDSWLAICLSCLLIGKGAYGLEEINLKDKATKKTMPIFIFGGVDDWFKANFGKTFEDAYSEFDKLKLAEALEAIYIDAPGFHVAIKYVSKDRIGEFIKDWNNRNRTSLNDIGGRALCYATSLREKYDNVDLCDKV